MTPGLYLIRSHMMTNRLPVKPAKYRKDHCEECYSTEELHLHHKDFNSRNSKLENLQTLCSQCHVWKHHPRQPIILDCIRSLGYATKREVAAELGWDLRIVKSPVDTLCRNGHIVTIGTDPDQCNSNIYRAVGQ